MGQPDLKTQELEAIVREIRDRVRARYPEGEAPGLPMPLPDLLPILHARDAAEAKVASIGSVNPRPPGPLNAVIQWTKQQISRGLGWFVRDQVDFNRGVLGAVEATLESLNEANRTFVAIGARLDELSRQIRNEAEGLKAEAAELKDIRVHWIRWREEWQQKLLSNEVHFLRSIADLQAAMHHRMVTLDANYRESLKSQHSEFDRAMHTRIDEVQRKLWADLERVRLEYEQLIHNELRVVRQKAALAPPAVAAPSAPVSGSTPAGPSFDYARFADRFRGSEEYVRNNQRLYAPLFQDRRNVLDIGCGRGEFLDVMKESGVPARGIDLDPESVALCRAKGHQADTADLFAYLADGADGAFDGIFAAQVVEHIPPELLPRMIGLCSAKLRRGGIFVLETPNPECLAIFATHFYLDPTHTRPIPPSLMVFYFEEFGLGGIEVRRLSPAVESMPSLAELPPKFREAFFDGLDYAIIGRKL
jgi:2-polyprenyl-3-methyl-5-hydroxy-6-metoxy-1,4-benzoquinol methylase